MTARFQGPLVDPVTGCVKFSTQSSAVRPADAVDFRGMAVAPDGTVYGISDTGQPRVFQDGIAIDPDTGLTILGSGPVVNISMGGLGVNAAGAIVSSSPPDLIHQGVGITNPGELCAGSVPTLFAFGEDGTGALKGLVNGTGSMTFARVGATATVTDFQPLVRPTLANELRFKNARRVRNLIITKSEDITSVDWFKTEATADDADTLTFSVSATARLGQRTGIASTGDNTGRAFILSCDAWVDAGTELFRLRIANIGQANYSTSNLTATTTRQRFSFLATMTADGSEVRPNITNASDAAARTIHVSEIQFEEVTGQSNQNPSEYVSVGVLSGDYHGAGVDSVKYFAYGNSNTVDGSGVVTEAQGAALSDWSFLGEPAATNYCLYSEDLSNAAWQAFNITKSSDGVQLPSGKTGTAETLTASGANGTLKQPITLASQANCYSVYLQRKTGTGNVDITLDDGVTWTTKTLTGVGTWDRVNVAGAAAANPIVGIRIVTSADAVQMWGSQLEGGAVPTSHIPTVAATVTRAVDDLTPFADLSGNADETEGMLIFDLEASTSSANLPATTAIVSLADAVNNLFRLESASPQLKSFDGANTVSAILAFVADNLYRFALRWNADLGEAQILYKDVDGAGAWQLGSVLTFDGAYPIGTAINILFGGPSSPLLIKNMRIYDSDQGASWIVDNS